MATAPVGKKGKSKRKGLQQQAAANPGQAQAEQQFALACHHHQQGQLEAAERGYRQTVQLDPARSDAWRNLGQRV